MRRELRRTAEHRVRLPLAAADDIRAALPDIADDVVAAIIEEVPSYSDAFAGPMGDTIRSAVQIALGGFLSLASGRSGMHHGTPTAPAVEGAYQLGRGEARSARSTDALLSAYRIGARVSWRAMSARGLHVGLDAETLAAFAGLVFAYIDELSAASVAGHTDELETTGRVRQRHLERLARHLLAGDELAARDEAAMTEWPMPRTLTAVLVPESQVRPVLGALPPRTLQTAEAVGLEDDVLLLVPDAHDRGRSGLLATLRGRGAVAGPPRPWAEVGTSFDRALRARRAGLEGDTEQHLPELVVGADAAALADLRRDVLAPLADLRPAAREKLIDTLRAWLLHQGRRDDVAAALFVHPQTVRYRMTQLREAYGDRLEHRETVPPLTIALAFTPPHGDPGPARPPG
ncbi:helix-turn-helix domain-containing protein [Nocardioides sp. R-C-SC26]|uniref:helix-turn-helix domain-containing protein n=1 Tax=Nocardioides sp. R-C-SC26 TaxID=2870414 RepID=UPI001E5BB460|nr:helix-turn-helix domain-containing protein [Nocardioides sp. R-C-SC26]